MFYYPDKYKIRLHIIIYYDFYAVKATIRASVYVKIVDRSISMSDDMVTARDNESRY